MNVIDVSARLEALGNPTRLEIVRTLVRAGNAGLAVGKLQEKIGIASSTLSHHLQKLIMVGLINQERRSTTLICRTNFPMMRTLVESLMAECCRDEARDPLETDQTCVLNPT
jgi:ArsR family transcriptional regulator